MKPNMEIIHGNDEDNDFVVNSMDPMSETITCSCFKDTKNGI